MVINESIISLNDSISSNITQNYTILISFAQDSNISQILESSVFTQIFPIITLIIGAVLTFLINILSEKLKEIKEIKRYEYTLIDDILDISKEDNKCDLMVDYFNLQKKDHRFVKIKNYKIVVDYMKKVIDGEEPDQSDLINIHKKLMNEI